MVMNTVYMHPADQLVMFMQRIYDKGLTTTSGGNLSICDENGDVWITPAGIDKGCLTREDIMQVKADGTVIGRHKPSSELPFHLSVYRRRPDLRAVLHAHPPALVAFSIVRKLPDLTLLHNVRTECEHVAMSCYEVPGSAELGESIGREFDKGNNIVFLENHGVCIGAKDMFSAFKLFESMEYAANLEILASKLGKPQGPAPESYALTQTSHHTDMPEFVPAHHRSEELAARRDMITFIHRSYRQGLFTATHGTYSVRLSDGSFLITPYGRDRAYLEPEDLVLVKDGKREEGKVPSRAVAYFEAVYRNNPDIHAVLLAMPPYAMSFAVTDAPFDPRTIPESYILLRDMAKVPSELMYTDAEAASKLLAVNRPAVMFQNDSVVVTGETLLKAFDRMEVLEATAHSIVLSRDVGEIVHITEKEIDDLKQAFHLEG